MISNVLITGGAGFLGLNLAKQLMKHHKITLIDNFSSGVRARANDFVKKYGIELIDHDICERLPDSYQFEVIFNLACIASPPLYQAESLKTLDTNYLGVRNLLEHAKNTGATLVQASTSEIYGDPEVSPQSEEYRGDVNTVGPRACYDEGKRVAETLVYEYHSVHKVNAKICRIFNTYGPYMRHDDGRVVSNFICQALRGDDITIYGDGSQSRSFCFVDDLIDGMFKLSRSKLTPEAPVNLGNPNERSVLELAETIIKLTDSKSKIVFKDLPVDDPKQRCPNISRARSLLDWEPKIDLETGLRKTIDHFRDVLSKI